MASIATASLRLSYTDSARHFHLNYPARWKIDTEVIYMEHYRGVFFSVNSMGRDQFRVKDLQTAPNQWEFGLAEIIKQMPRGGAYVDIGCWEGPPQPPPPADKQMTANDLFGLLAKAKDEYKSGKLIARSIDFAKQDKYWSIVVYMRPPIDVRVRDQMQRVLESFRFDEASAQRKGTP